MPVNKIKTLICGVVLGLLLYAGWRIWLLPAVNSRFSLLVPLLTAAVWVLYEFWNGVKLERRLYHLQKLEALGRLAGGMAHDFNNVLGGILGAAEIVDKKTAEESDLKQYVKIIENACVRLQYLAGEMLGFSRQKTEKCQIFNLYETAADSINLLRAGLENGYELDYRCEHKGMQVCASKDFIESIILNLVLNAKDAMKQGGKITVILRRRRLDKNNEGYLLPARKGMYAEIEVKDEGCGIKKANLDKIFKPYFTTKAKGRGTGLGLSAVYEGVKRCKGNLAVETSKKGTTLRVCLPLVKDHWQIKALVIDDDEIFGKVLCGMLENLGLQTEWCRKAADGTKKAANADIVWIDMQLPELTGTEVYQKIQHDFPEIKAVLMSGRDYREEAEKAAQGGNIPAFMEKPCTVQDCKLILHHFNLD